MLTNQLRPTTWKEVAGQKTNIQILKSIIRNPEKAPRTLIFEGEYGTGKTSSARIMARELNNIKDPNFDLNNCPFYYEYDSTVIGNVDKIRELRDVFGVGSGDYWKVIVFDEVHATSKPAQTALLKILEEVKGKTFFILCTTHVHKVLPTIRSRSLELKFGLVNHDEIVEHLNIVAEKLGKEIPDDIKHIIASRANGHMRNVHMLLDKYFLIGDEVFRQTVKTSIDLLCDFFMAVKVGNDAKVIKTINDILDLIPLDNIKTDFSELIMLSMQELTGFGSSNPKIKQLVEMYKSDILKIVKIYYSDWAKNMFRSGYDFKSLMLCMYSMLKNEIKQTSISQNNVLKNRAMVRR